jgi:hypothetical protein
METTQKVIRNLSDIMDNYETTHLPETIDDYETDKNSLKRKRSDLEYDSNKKQKTFHINDETNEYISEMKRKDLFASLMVRSFNDGVLVKNYSDILKHIKETDFFNKEYENDIVRIYDIKHILDSKKKF